jgi:hypothetical protein
VYFIQPGTRHIGIENPQFGAGSAYVRCVEAPSIECAGPVKMSLLTQAAIYPQIKPVCDSFFLLYAGESGYTDINPALGLERIGRYDQLFEFPESVHVRHQRMWGASVGVHRDRA